MDLNHRTAGYEPAGMTWLPHPADSVVATGAYISVYLSALSDLIFLTYAITTSIAAVAAAT